MRAVRGLWVAGVIGLAVYGWKGRDGGLNDAPRSPNGFVAVVMPDGSAPDTVIILAPLNCPSDAARRADGLARELARHHIPYTRTASFSAVIDDPTPQQQAELQRAATVLDGPIPAVFINGMAKANPTAEEVLAEYRGHAR